MAQVTAVEWLLIWFDNNNYYISNEIAQAFNQAKAMEKKQIEDAWEDGKGAFSTRQPDKYYNETYGSNNQI